MCELTQLVGVCIHLALLWAELSCTIPAHFPAATAAYFAWEYSECHPLLGTFRHVFAWQ